MEPLSQRIEKARKVKGLTRPALASRLNVDKQTIYQWEKGSREPDDEKKRRIAETLGVSVSYLIGETDSPEPASEWTLAIVEPSKSEVPVPPDWQSLKAAVDLTAAAIEFQRVTFVEAVHEQREAYGKKLDQLEKTQEKIATALDRLAAAVEKLEARQEAAETAGLVPLVEADESRLLRLLRLAADAAAAEQSGVPPVPSDLERPRRADR